MNMLIYNDDNDTHHSSDNKTEVLGCDAGKASRTVSLCSDFWHVCDTEDVAQRL